MFGIYVLHFSLMAAFCIHSTVLLMCRCCILDTGLYGWGGKLYFPPGNQPFLPEKKNNNTGGRCSCALPKRLTNSLLQFVMPTNAIIPSFITLW